MIWRWDAYVEDGANAQAVAGPLGKPWEGIHPVRLYWSLAYIDASVEILWEKNIVSQLKSSSREQMIIVRNKSLVWSCQ